MPRKTLLLFLTLFATACNPLQGNSPNLNPSQRGSDPLAGLSFKPISASTATLLDGAQSATTGAAAPAVAPMNPSTVCAMPPYYDYGAYGFSEQMSLVSMFEAEAPGYGGNSFQEMIRKIVSPVLKDWSSDARLIQTSGNVDAGECASDEAAWSLSYASKSREETLDFSVGKSKTKVIRKAWGPLDLAPDKISIDSAVALKTVQDAIPNKNAQSEEARTGIDYFFKTSIPNISQGAEQEILYRLPTDARWNIRLQNILGKTVWEIDSYSVAAPMPASEPGVARATTSNQASYVSEYAHGMIDAQSGTLIRLTRPCKYTYSTGQGSTGIIPPATPVYK